MKESPIYKQELEKVFRYKVESNILERKLRSGEWKIVNSSVANCRGYVRVNFKKRMIYAHRAIYTLVNGNIPENMQVDHIDNVKINNNINNLQILSNRDNIAKSLDGLTPKFSKDRNTYIVQEMLWVGKDRHSFSFGCFKTKCEAQLLCDAYNNQMGYGRPLYKARLSTHKYWRECLQGFKDSYFKNKDKSA